MRESVRAKQYLMQYRSLAAKLEELELSIKAVKSSAERLTRTVKSEGVYQQPFNARSSETAILEVMRWEDYILTLINQQAVLSSEIALNLAMYVRVPNACKYLSEYYLSDNWETYENISRKYDRTKPTIIRICNKGILELEEALKCNPERFTFFDMGCSNSEPFRSKGA